MKIGLYETDAQDCFSFRDGTLFVSALETPTEAPYGAEVAVPQVRKAHQHARENGYAVLGSVDRHFKDDPELIRNGGPFPDHGMNGTKDQLRIEDLDNTLDIYIQNKEGVGLPPRILSEQEITDRITALEAGYQLIFEKQSYDVGTNPNFAPTMTKIIENGLETIAFDAFATDYCVRAAVLKTADVAEAIGKTIGKDFHIYVITDAIKEVNLNFELQPDMQFGQKALEEMYARGVKPITTQEVLEGKLEAN